MDITAFFVDALGSALELGVATPDDVLKHATPDVLAAHLPRPEWAKLIAACLAAPRVDARLVVDTITVRTLCQHVPGSIVWACLLEIGQRALGKSILAAPPAPVATPPSGTPAITTTPSGEGSGPTPLPGAARTPTLRMGSGAARVETPASGVPIARASSPSISTLGATLGATTGATTAADEPPPLGAPPSASARPGAVRPEPGRSPLGGAGNGIRATGAGASTRRPQAQAPGAATRPGSRTTPPPMRRPTTGGADFDIDTDLSADWKKGDAVAVDPLAVDDDQLVDWAQDETSTNGPTDRKR